MKRCTLLAAILAVVVAAQIAVPASLLIKHELTLRHGTAWKFKTAPVDPVDAFRGRYVALRFEQSGAPTAPGVNLSPGSRAFALLEQDAAGFARVTLLTNKAPVGKPFLAVHTSWQDRGQSTFTLPLDRFYMEEHIAPKAEEAYWSANRGRSTTNVTSYALVRVRNGVGVVENVFIGNRTLAERARQLR